MIRRSRLDDEHPLPTVFTPEDLAAARARWSGNLAPCPHCNGDGKPPDDGRSLRIGNVPPTLALVAPQDGFLSQTWRIVCFASGCGAAVLFAKTADEAAARWNRRVPCATPT